MDRLRIILGVFVAAVILATGGCDGAGLGGVTGSDAGSGAGSAGTGSALPVIQESSGSRQVGSPGEALDEQLTVTVGNAVGPVQGVDVTWATSDGTLVGESVTDRDGVARADWTLGDDPARRFADATASIATSSVDFIAVVLPGTDEVVRVTTGTIDPASLKAPSGATVTWVWFDPTVQHNIEPMAGSVLPRRSGDPVEGPFLYSQELFSGTYNYQCAAHGDEAAARIGP